ncbi:Crp/Fnr family transcriptional regulator [Paraflavitalea pollutisoli]|uniref:Crp/Fnr family transcriptional regulator n=1 Tax=Paraflavitalea pollutisoli TaxID=3034143 RepID=UPI0023EC5FE3|nr:Crp/Fnr family transcriptional regulator [Paraflavitalea sp. H1-2-19X]
MNEMIACINAMRPLSDEINTHLARLIRCQTFKKGEYLLRAGDVSHDFYFVSQGLLRCYANCETTGKEATRTFTKEGEFFLLPQNVKQTLPGNEYLHALEDTTVYAMSYIDLHSTIEKYLAVYNFLIRLGCQHNSQLREAVSIMLEKSAFQKCTWLAKKHPELTKRVSSKHLASYVGAPEKMIRRYGRYSFWHPCGN